MRKFPLPAAFISLFLAAGGQAGAAGSDTGEQARDDAEAGYYKSIKEGLDLGIIKGPEALRYHYYKLMAAANAAGNPDDVLPKLVITLTGPKIGGLQEILYAAVIPDSGRYTHGVVTTGDWRQAWFKKLPRRFEDDQKTVIEVESRRASLCTKTYVRRTQMPFLGRRCEERLPIVVWLDFGYATSLYFFSQDVMNACETPEKNLPLDIRAYKIRGEVTDTGIVAKGVVRCEKSKKTAAIHLETQPSWGR